MAMVKIFEYMSPGDTCANCGKSGGNHHTSGSKSWCFRPSDREDNIDNPAFHTRFSYIKNSTLATDNPNRTFRRRS